MNRAEVTDMVVEAHRNFVIKMLSSISSGETGKDFNRAKIVAFHRMTNPNAADPSKI